MVLVRILSILGSPGKVAFLHGPTALSGIQSHRRRHLIHCESLCYAEFPIPTLEANDLLCHYCISGGFLGNGGLYQVAFNEQTSPPNADRQ